MPSGDFARPSFRLEDLEGIALANNPTLGEARALVNAMRGKWVQAGLPPNTWLGYSGQQLGSAGQAEQQGVYIAQEFITGGKLRLNRAVAAQEIQLAERQFAEQQQRVLTDVRIRFYEVLVAQRRVDLSGNLLAIVQKALETIEALHRGQEVSLLDVLRARVELQTTDLALKIARNSYSAAWGRLTAVLGTPGMPPCTLVGSLDENHAALDPELAMARILSESPQIAAAIAEIERSRWAVERARAEVIPNVDVQGIVQHDNSTGSSNGNLQVALPIPWLNRNQGGIRQSYAELVAAERALNRTELNLQQNLATVYQQYANARNQVVDFTKPEGILDNARKALDLVNKGYEAGEISYLDLLTAQRTNAQTTLTYVEALGELWTAIAEIEGLLLKDSLAAPAGGQ